MRSRLLLSAFLLVASACVVVAHPAPPPRVLPAPEAVAIATDYARSRGLVIDYTHAHRLDRRGRWHVDLGGAGGRDRAVVVIDGFSGRVLSARLRGGRGELAPAPPPGPGYEPAPPAAPGAAPPSEPAEPGAPPPGAPPPPSAPPPPPR